MINAEDFSVGDRVVIEGPGWIQNRNYTIGLEGVVVAISGKGRKAIGVRHDLEIPHGHTCNGSCKDGYGWWYGAKSSDAIEAVSKHEPVKPDDLFGMFI